MGQVRAPDLAVAIAVAGISGLATSEWVGKKYLAIALDWSVSLVANGDGNGASARRGLPWPLRRYAPSWIGANPQLTAVTIRSRSNDKNQPRTRAHPPAYQPHRAHAQWRGSVASQAAMGARNRAQGSCCHPITPGRQGAPARLELSCAGLPLKPEQVSAGTGDG